MALEPYSAAHCGATGHEIASVGASTFAEVFSGFFAGHFFAFHNFFPFVFRWVLGFLVEGVN